MSWRIVEADLNSQNGHSTFEHRYRSRHSNYNTNPRYNDQQPCRNNEYHPQYQPYRNSDNNRHYVRQTQSQWSSKHNNNQQQPNRQQLQRYQQKPQPLNTNGNGNGTEFTRSYSFMDSFVDYQKPTIIFDIDGTIANIQNRLNLCTGANADGSRTREQWDVVLNGDYYKYDRVIHVAFAYLKYIDCLNKYNIIYLSGRRAKTISATRHWLFRVNGYPQGFIIHRFVGVSGRVFKEQQLVKLSRKLNIVAYFGDRVVDDCGAAIKAGVRPILVLQNEWMFTKHINGGMRAVLEDIVANRELNASQKQDIESIIDMAKQSKFWNMSYEDLIPREFATETFYNENKELLPDNLLAKLESDKHSENRVVVHESKEMHVHQNKIKHEENNNGKDDAYLDTLDLNKTENDKDIACRIQFCQQQQGDLDQKYQWMPVGQSICYR